MPFSALAARSAGWGWAKTEKEGGQGQAEGGHDHVLALMAQSAPSQPMPKRASSTPVESNRRISGANKLGFGEPDDVEGDDIYLSQKRDPDAAADFEAQPREIRYWRRRLPPSSCDGGEGKTSAR